MKAALFVGDCEGHYARLVPNKLADLGPLPEPSSLAVWKACSGLWRISPIVFPASGKFHPR